MKNVSHGDFISVTVPRLQKGSEGTWMSWFDVVAGNAAGGQTAQA